jgi:hypothetical protein
VFCPLWPLGPRFSLKRLQSLPAPYDEDKPDERPPGEVDYDLMVLESLAALDGPQVPDDAVMAVAHSSQMAVLETPHVESMHWAAIPSILDRLESKLSGSESSRLTFRRSPGVDAIGPLCKAMSIGGRSL